jgi:hypothetical protein
MLRIIAYITLALSAMGIVACFSLFLLQVTGVYEVPATPFPLAGRGIFIVWLPTIFVVNKLSKDFKQKDLWKAALRGCPPWMRGTLWIVTGSVMAVFLWSVISRSGPKGFPPLFTIFPVTFYGASFCVMYSFLNFEEFDSTRRCLNGHAIAPLSKFCEECGAPAMFGPKTSGMS